MHKAFEHKANFTNWKTMPNKWKGDTPIYNNIQPLRLSLYTIYNIYIYVTIHLKKYIWLLSGDDDVGLDTVQKYENIVLCNSKVL